MMFSLVTLFLLPLVTTACQCQGTTVSDALSSADVVVRGTVTRELPLSEARPTKRLVVKVNRVVKGCTIVASDRIVVTTPASTANCGVTTKVGTEYVFAGRLEELDSPTAEEVGNAKVTQAVSVTSCSYHRQWSAVPGKDRTVLRHYTNVCPVTCTTGTDCPLHHYCDVNTCVSFDAKCDPRIKAPTCKDDPCVTSTAFPPCPTSQRCLPSICGGCFPVHVDITNTRVCV